MWAQFDKTASISCCWCCCCCLWLLIHTYSYSNSYVIDANGWSFKVIVSSISKAIDLNAIKLPHICGNVSFLIRFVFICQTLIHLIFFSSSVYCLGPETIAFDLTERNERDIHTISERKENKIEKKKQRKKMWFDKRKQQKNSSIESITKQKKSRIHVASTKWNLIYMRYEIEMKFKKKRRRSRVHEFSVTLIYRSKMVKKQSTR